VSHLSFEGKKIRSTTSFASSIWIVRSFTLSLLVVIQ
jgi:hypothetical protein